MYCNLTLLFLQFENGCYRSPLSEPVHDNNGGGSPIISQFRNKSDSFGQVYSNGYPNIEEMNSLKLLSSNQNDADHFGYLSTIPQVDFTGNENLFASNNGHLNGSHPAEDRYRHAGKCISLSCFPIIVRLFFL